MRRRRFRQITEHERELALRKAREPVMIRMRERQAMREEAAREFRAARELHAMCTPELNFYAPWCEQPDEVEPMTDEQRREFGRRAKALMEKKEREEAEVASIIEDALRHVDLARRR